MAETQKDPATIAKYEKIAEYEKNGWWDKDIENDPPFEPLNPDKFDWPKKKLYSKIMSRISTNAGRKFYEGWLKKKIVIYSGATGLDNLKDFNKGAIVTCNHFHIFDNYAVLLALKEFDKKTRLFRVIRDGNFVLPGIFGLLMKHCDTLPINHDGRSPRTTVKCMSAVKELVKKDKNKVLIYPEQAMWFNYRKPRPLKSGAFQFAAKAGAPIIPCFITLKDSDVIGADGFPVQEFTVNVLPVIQFNPGESVKENAARMMSENYRLWKECYEKTYGIKLEYNKR